MFSFFKLIMMKIWARILWNKNVLWLDEENVILFPKLFWRILKKKSIDQEKNLKFEAEGWEFAKILRSIEQIIRTEKCQYNFWKISKIQYIIAISIQMEKNDWDLEAYRKSLKILHFMAITGSAILPSFSVISSVVSNLIYEIIMLLKVS